ncbi:MAG: L,D-transpeptidase [Proteobacteria bacterium]|nr:L,D-transpeptidase [Pseudomonadota bacterium]
MDMMKNTLDRRALLRGSGLLCAATALAGCSQTFGMVEHPPEVMRRPSPRLAELEAMYGPLPDERFPVPAVDLDEVEEGALRRIVPYRTAEYPGTLVVDTREHALFLVMEGGEALRYGVGVGREGLAWQGRATVGRKAEWPRWTPTRDMIAREPERNAPWAGGMPPGLENPLGARALYLYRGTQDTLYRIHGTNEPWSIGQSVSSGCIRMINQDVIDLYRRVPLGAPVVVQL